MVKHANVMLASFKMTSLLCFCAFVLKVAMETSLAGLELSHLHRFATFHLSFMHELKSVY